VPEVRAAERLRTTLTFSWQAAMERDKVRREMLGRIFGPCPCRCHRTPQEHVEPCCRQVADQLETFWPPAAITRWLEAQ
jgi:hypothetical protein